MERDHCHWELTGFANNRDFTVFILIYFLGSNLESETRIDTLIVKV